MFERVAEQMREISRPLVGALIVVSRVAAETFEAFAGPLKDAFSDLAPVIAEFAGILGEAFETLAPTIGPITDAFIQILEELGPALANEVFPDLADAIVNLANAIGDNADTFVDILTWFLSIPEAIINFLAELTRLAGWFQDNPAAIIVGLLAIGAVLGVLVAGPVGLFVGALIGLGIALFQFRDQAREIFNNVRDVIFGFVGRAAEKFFEFRTTALRWLSNLGSGAGKIFTALREAAIEKLRRLGEGVRNIFNSVVSFVSTLPSRIASAASGMWNSIVSGFKSALNAIISGWNNLSFTTPSVDLGPLGSFGGFTIGTPNIPLLQRGGLIQRAGIAEVGEAGRETVFLPAGAVVAPGPAERFIPESGGLPDEFEATAIIDLGYDIRRVINLIFRRVTSNARAGQGAVA
jgi:phage-related protein